MTRQFSASEFDYAVLEPLATSEGQIIVPCLTPCGGLLTLATWMRPAVSRGERALSCGELIRGANAGSTHCYIV